MSIGNLKDQGNKGNNFPYQLGSLQLLGDILTAIQALPTDNYELRITPYKAIAAGAGYSIGDFITRTDIIDVPTGTIASTLWFNETTGAAIAAPPIANLTPYIPPSAVTVSNLPAALGQTNMAGSLSVTIASNQSAVAVTLPSGAQTITSSTETNSTNSPVTAGATSVGFTTSATFTGSINGIARSASTYYSFDAAPGKTLPAIAYTVTAGSMIIDKIA